MRQSAQSLSWLLFLALLPGCALFGGGSANDAPKKIYDRRDWEETHPEQPTPTPGVEEPRPTVTLLPAAPDAKAPGVMGVLALDPSGKGNMGTMGVATQEPPKRNPGIAGIVSVEDLFDPMGLKSVAAQAAPPPPNDKKAELAPLTQAIQFMLDGRHQDAIQVLSVYDKETQEFFLRVLPPLTIFAKTPISKLSPQEIELVANSFDSLHEYLRPRCALLVNRMQPCEEIRDFGDFAPLPDNHAFLNATKDRPGERVLLYVELKNFASVKGKDGMYLTKLACSLELKDSNNKRVGELLKFDDKQTTYRRSTCMNDYHGKFSFYVPPIPPGTYKLILQVSDLTIPNEGRVARKELDFRVTPVANQTTLRGE